jgi:hypothetical protein
MYALAKTLVRPGPSKKFLISELETGMKIIQIESKTKNIQSQFINIYIIKEELSDDTQRSIGHGKGKRRTSRRFEVYGFPGIMAAFYGSDERTGRIQL